MDKDTAKLRLYEVIKKGIRHENYKRVTEVADKAYKLVTGDKIETLLSKFVREDEAMFTQRKDITRHITMSMLRNVRSIFYKVPRSNNVSRIIGYDSKDEKKPAELENILSRFWGVYSMDHYMSTRLIDIEQTDPNAWVIVEWPDFDNISERAKPYPFEVTSAEAIDFKIFNNITEYLITYINRKNEPERYTIYTKEQAVTLVFEKDKILNYSDVEIEIGDEKFVTINNKTYRIIEPEPYNLTAVPAIRPGVEMDLMTSGKTFVPMWWGGLSFIEKTLKLNSEFDLATSLVVYPQRIQYVDRCDNPDCQDGKCADGETCQTCKGTGKKLTSSVQDVITLKMPRDPSDMMQLENILRYVSPGVDILQLMDGILEKWTRRFKSVVFNTDIFDREAIADTATGKNIDLQNVYDTLYPYALSFGNAWKFFVEIVAQVTDLSEGLMAQYNFNRDFKLKTKNDLISDLTAVTQSGGSSILKEEIENDILRIDYSDRPEEYKIIQLKKRFIPFKGKDKNEIMFILTNGLTDAYNKTLWSNFDAIFDEVLFEYPNLYELPVSRQEDLIDAKVQEYVTRIKAEQPRTRALFEPDAE